MRRIRHVWRALWGYPTVPNDMTPNKLIAAAHWLDLGDEACGMIIDIVKARIGAPEDPLLSGAEASVKSNEVQIALRRWASQIERA